MAYIGRPLQVANLAVQSGTGDGSDTTPIATLDYATTTNGIAVYLDGVRQLAGTDFNVTAQTTLTFTTAPANGVGVDVYFLGLELSLPTPADGTVATAKIADDAVTLAKMAPGTDGNIISYDASGNPVAIATGTDGQVLTSTGAGSPPAFEALPAGGKVLQVVTVHKTDVYSTTSKAWGDITGMSVSITPASSSNKVLVLYSISCGCETGGAYGGYVKLLRDTTDINIGDASNSNTRATGSMYTNDWNYDVEVIAGCYLDSPSTTSGTAYKFQAFAANAGTAFYINRPGHTSTADSIGRFPSTITLMEIAG